MKAKDILTTHVVTVRGAATVAAAVELMRQHSIHALVVEKRDDEDAFGIVTDTDIVFKVAAYGANPECVRVFEIMSKPCIEVNPDLGVEYVARLFANANIRHAPVVRGTQLLGIISINDLLSRSHFVDNPQRIYIEDEIEAARDRARAICAASGDTSPECAAAWDVVEELQAEAAHQRARVSD
ncbi:CBS domain protein [Rubidibacter lacunae KORDI 51-2]|uniref:CBS domain protein n=1 Tax=Rubidibacter lacunae KORDI 51-2 TaxID=582515 RepID=U5DJM5_9CHRO|nr:CBS domain-containing protein [Rubidibacter lacunae]ERN40784.1 CBS domain protein [Rubidibacter lacunae KORDI 51-2]